MGSRKPEIVTVTQARKGFPVYLGMAGTGERVIIVYERPTRSRAARAHGIHTPYAAIIGLKDLDVLQATEELEALCAEAEQDKDLRDALEGEGLPIEALRVAFQELRSRWADDRWHGNLEGLRQRAIQKAKDAKLRRAFEEAGVEVSWPTGKRVKRPKPLSYDPGGELISEQIIRERR